MTYRETAAEDRSLLITGLNGKIIAIEVASGKARWEYRLGHRGTVETIVHRGRLYAHAMGQSFVVLDYLTGRVVAEHPAPSAWNGRPTMLIDGTRFFLASGGEIFCYDLDGNLLWENPMSGKGTGGVALAMPDNARQADQN